MTSNPARGGRRAVSDEEARYHLRLTLMEHYRADPRYQAIVRQDLAPLWSAAAAAPGWPTRETPIHPADFGFFEVVEQLRELEEQAPGSPAAPHVGRYVGAVIRTGALTMGLTSRGRPATWALLAVHDDASGRSRRPRRSTVPARARDDDLALSLSMTPNSVSVRAFPDPDGGEPSIREDFDLSARSVGYGADHWAELERTACTVIRDGVAAMRQGIEARYPLRNPTSLARWPDDVDALFRALFHGERPVGSGGSDRLRRIASQLEIDPPSRRTERVPSEWPIAQVLDLQPSG